MMGAVRQNDGTTAHRDEADRNVADPGALGGGPSPKPNALTTDHPCASWGPRTDPPTDPGAPPLEVLLSGSFHSRAVVMLLTMAAAPFLKGILAGLALAGAAAAVREALGA